VILGAPGPVNWRGTIFKNSMNQSLEAGTEEWINSPVEDVLPGLEGIQPEPASGFYAYLGMVQRHIYLHRPKIFLVVFMNCESCVIGLDRFKLGLSHLALSHGKLFDLRYHS
jgi:hypothetical protein